MIHHEIQVNATPKKVYDTLINADKFSAISGGAPTEIDTNEGGRFSCFGGYVTGRQLELVANQRIVQSWRGSSWPAGIHSVVRFELVANDKGTSIQFDHVGFPEDQKEHLESGWYDNYWKGLQAAFE